MQSPILNRGARFTQIPTLMITLSCALLLADPAAGQGVAGAAKPALEADALTVAASGVVDDPGVGEPHEGVPEQPVLDEVAPDEVGQERLVALRKARNAAYDLEGDVRDARLVEVAGLYRELAEDDGRSPLVRSEAAFRGAELMRARRLVDEADALFARAVELGKAGGVEFAARGLLERAHIRRRDERWEEALRLYVQVTEGFGDHPRSAAHALTWTGKVHLQTGDFASAKTAVEAFADTYGERYPVEAIRNAERWGRLALSQGHEDAVHALSARIREQMGRFITEHPDEAEEIGEALDDLDVTLGTPVG